MSRRVGNKQNVARKGKVFARQTVRLGWRKRKWNAILQLARETRAAAEIGLVTEVKE